MMDHSFSLVDEPWIPVIDDRGQVSEIGLAGALLSAHRFKDLACASPPEQVAVLRLLLAVVYRLYGGPRVSGLSENTWCDLYDAGRFDSTRVQGYLETWRHRLDLFDLERPFFQVPAIVASDGEPAPRASIALLAFDRSSGNNATLFDHSTDDAPPWCSPAQAARMLLAFQAFAAGGRVNNERKSKKSGLLRGGVQLFVQGDSLWQTLVLNLLDGDPYPVTRRPDIPCWEQDTVVESTVRQPGGWLDAMTWQARRVVLHPEVVDGGTAVREVTIAGGFDPVDDSLVDPHVQRRSAASGKKKLIPLKLAPDKALWRNAAALYGLHERGTERHTVVEQLRERRADGDLPAGVGRRLRVLGMATDKSKVLLWRDESLPLPERVLADPLLLHAVETGLEAGEKAWRDGVKRALTEAARVTLAPLADDLSGEGGRRGGKTLDDEARALIKTTAAESTYWATLGRAFPLWIERLERGIEDASLLWRDAVLAAAREAFEAGRRGLGESALAWKGAASARRRLEWGLADATRSLQPQEDDRV